jgi:hypothetical protein
MGRNGDQIEERGLILAGENALMPTNERKAIGLGGSLGWFRELLRENTPEGVQYIFVKHKQAFVMPSSSVSRAKATVQLISRKHNELNDLCIFMHQHKETMQPRLNSSEQG